MTARRRALSRKVVPTSSSTTRTTCANRPPARVGAAQVEAKRAPGPRRARRTKARRPMRRGTPRPACGAGWLRAWTERRDWRRPGTTSCASLGFSTPNRSAHTRSEHLRCPHPRRHVGLLLQEEQRCVHPARAIHERERERVSPSGAAMARSAGRVGVCAVHRYRLPAILARLGNGLSTMDVLVHSTTVRGCTESARRRAGCICRRVGTATSAARISHQDESPPSHHGALTIRVHQRVGGADPDPTHAYRRSADNQISDARRQFPRAKPRILQPWWPTGHQASSLWAGGWKP